MLNPEASRLDSKFEQPVIVAVGLTSAGKSSTLERVIGTQLFPVGKDQKTNMPIKLVLTHDPNGDHNTVTVQYVYSCGVLSGMFRRCADYAPELSRNHPLYGGKEVRVNLKRANELIDDLMARTAKFDAQRKGRTVKLNHVTEQPVIVRIRSPCVPSMVIIDLPGMESISAGKTEADINQNNKKIITDKYLDKKELFPQSIVLMVRSATINTQTAEACDTNSIREFNREYDTIGVISKCNKHDDDQNYDDLADLLEDTDSKVGVVPVAARGGFIGLHGRSSVRYPTLDLADQLKIEENWFKTHTSISKNHWGVETLIDGINSMMEEPIMYLWGPAAVGQICKSYIAEKEKGYTFGTDPKELHIADLTRAVGQAFMERVLATSHLLLVADLMKIEDTLLHACPVSAHKSHSAWPSATFFGTSIEVGPSDKRDIGIACIAGAVREHASDFVEAALQEELFSLKAALLHDDISNCPTSKDNSKRCLRMNRFEAYHDAVISAVTRKAGITTTRALRITDLSGPALSAVADVRKMLVNQVWKVSGSFRLADGAAIRDWGEIITEEVTRSIIQRAHSVMMEALRIAKLSPDESGQSDAQELVVEAASWAVKRNALVGNLSKIRKMAKRVMKLIYIYIIGDGDSLLSKFNSNSEFFKWCGGGQQKFAISREEMSLKREKAWRGRHILH